MNTSLLSTTTVAALVGATAHTIRYWVKTKLVKPSGAQASGKGTRLRFTFPDVVAIKTVQALRSKGCPLQKIRAAVKVLRAEHPETRGSSVLARLTLLTDGRRVYLLSNERQILDVVTKQHVWSIAIGQIILSTKSKIAKLPRESTQAVKVSGRTYHLILIHDPDTDTYTAQCKELPGAIEQGDSLRKAVASGKEAIRSVLAFKNKRRGVRHVGLG